MESFKIKTFLVGHSFIMVAPERENCQELVLQEVTSHSKHQKMVNELKKLLNDTYNKYMYNNTDLGAIVKLKVI